MNDVVIYTILALLVAAFLGFISYYKKKDGKAQERVRAPRPRVGEDGAAGGVHPPNRAAANRNARARMRAAAQRRDDDSDEEDDDVAVVGDDIALPDGKLGKKKLAKLQAKADKRAMREADEREREERKERAVQAAEDRRREEEREAEEESKREDEERKAREEKERQELEEYMKLKAQFEVQEEGFDEAADEDNEQNLLNEFVGYIKGEKVVVLEDLAAKFKLKTQDVINRVSELQKEGTLTGVIDDRGKFIYISKQELEGIAKFIKQHGRVSIAELAESSNTLITLTPETSGAS
ncbi:DDRGK domain-containing protein 1-like [Homarus americanus]|uniref:DDRGK domain-containing protein 1-like n=1 Tax=Homarus americanus TaxID=6706 RepID=UPI001C48107D|nr:DDRGK domain-containing protein 1-like [Homarus americanus]